MQASASPEEPGKIGTRSAGCAAIGVRVDTVPAALKRSDHCSLSRWLADRWEMESCDNLIVV